MRHRYSFLTLLTILVLLVVSSACGNTKQAKNENLPEGMVGGLWMSPSYGYAFAFFNDGVVATSDGSYGAYQLMSDGTLLLQFKNASERVDVSVSASGERIIMNIASSGDIVFDLVLPDKSSGNLEREIVGKWQSVDVLNREELNTLTEDSMMEFTRNGTVRIVNPGAENNEEPHGIGTYELIGGKLVWDDGGYFHTLIVSSIGDLLFIREAGLDYGSLYVRR